MLETTCLARYPWPVDITYDQGVEFLGHELRNILIENDYGIKTKLYSSGNPKENAITERIHQVLGNFLRTYNLQETYIDDSDPWMGILAEADFAVSSTYHRKKIKIPGRLVFGRHMILPINHIANWRYIRQRKKSQIDKYVIRENTTRIDHYYRVGDKLMTKTKSAYKYENLFKGPY